MAMICQVHQGGVRGLPTWAARASISPWIVFEIPGSRSGDRKTVPNIPPTTANRRSKNRSSPFLYRDRKAIERMFGDRSRDFRRMPPGTTDQRRPF